VQISKLITTAGSLLLSAAALATNAPADPHKRALLIAIQGYERFGKEWQRLDGTVNDIVLMKDVLVRRYGFPLADITMVCDDHEQCTGEPTRKGIAAAFDALVRSTSSDDLVYIHYSGHGDRVDDKNGDESDGKDSALVPIDARDNGSWEILDDEIAVWLARLGDKTKDVIFVSDSCHSGTITRGAKSMKTRGVPIPDTRDYSWSSDPRKVPKVATRPERLVRLSAARDEQKAHEYEGPDKRTYGRFTWYWAEALTSAQPGQTYDEVFRSVAAMMPSSEQQPVLEGAGNAALFGRRFVERPRQIAAVRVSGAQVEFNDGLLTGVTKGSVYDRLITPLKVTIDAVDAYHAIGSVQGGGTVQRGDLFSEVLHAYHLPPLRVAVRADHPKKDATITKELADAVKKGLADAVQVVSDNERSDVILHLARATRDAMGQPNLAADGLPTRDNPDGSLECWILEDTESLFKPNLLVALADVPRDADTQTHESRFDHVVANVDVIVRNRSFFDAVNDGAQALRGKVSVEALRPANPRGDETLADLIEIGFDHAHGGRKRQRLDPILTNSSGEAEMKNGEIITFRVANGSNSAQYFYVVNVPPSGDVRVSFPEKGNDKDGRVEAGAIKVLADATYEVEGPRDVYVWFITKEPVNIWALEVAGYRSAATRVGVDDTTPLGDLLRRAAMGTRGKGVTGPSEYATRKVVVRVQ